MNTNMQVVTQILLKEAQDGFSKGKGNFVLSPSLLEVSLCLVAAGAKGQTLEQLLSFLGMKSVDDAHIKSPSLKLIELISNNGNSTTTEVCYANGVWVDNRFSLVPSYQGVLNKIYKVEAKYVDFFNKGDQVIEEVNSWVDNATRGLIKEIISHQTLDKDTMLILANALYYKGRWACGYQFDARMTQKRDFHLHGGSSVSVPFMTSWDRTFYRYGHFNGCKTLMIPYQKGCETINFSMYFFLPDKKDGLRNLIEKFNADSKLIDQHFELQMKELSELWVPKFKFSYDIDASERMKELGLTLPFMAAKELTGIVDSPLGDKLFIKKMIQKACIEIDEEGTVAAAAAATSFVCRCACGPPPPRPSFVADHPFMFMIREETSGAVLFMGAVLNPQQ